MLRKLSRSPVVIGALATILVFFWQSLTVHHNYHGRWSALFYIGDRWTPPPELAFENLYVFQNNPGYDGAFYHLVAHDPLFEKGFASHVDDPSLRWRRILIPGLALRVPRKAIDSNRIDQFLGEQYSSQ